MDFIRNWVTAIASATIIIATISAICPKNSAGRIASLCGNILLSFTLLSPIKAFDISVIEKYDAQITGEIREKTEMFEAVSNNAKKCIIEENLQTYILQKAKNAGIDCQVRIYCKDALPYSASVTCGKPADLKIVAAIIETELGVPLQRQVLRTEGA